MKSYSQLLYYHLCKLRNQNWRKIPGNTDQRFFHNDKYLAEECQMSVSSVRRGRAQLLANKYIDWWMEGNKSWYRILDNIYSQSHEKHRDKDALKFNFAGEAEKWLS